MDKRRYLKSLADELNVQETRVRDLIGSSHWLSDGHHKEYLLAGLIGRHLPAEFRHRRAFVVDASDGSCSKEIDLALLDDTRGLPIFDQGGLAVVLVQSVCAAVTVKTTLSKVNVKDAVANLASVRRLAPGAAMQGEQGQRLVLQANVRRGGNNSFLVADSVGIQVRLDRRDPDFSREGSKIWRMVRFSFGGSQAVPKQVQPK
jgi:hypothetical protein